MEVDCPNQRRYEEKRRQCVEKGTFKSCVASNWETNLNIFTCLLRWGRVRNPPTNAGDASWIPGPGRFLGVGNGNPLQYSCLENSRDRGAWQATVHGVTETWTRLSTQSFNLRDKLFQVVLVVENLPANAGDIRDVGLNQEGREDPREEEMTTHSSILAWRSPWAEEPGGLQSMGSQTVRCDWSNLAMCLGS